MLFFCFRYFVVGGEDVQPTPQMTTSSSRFVWRHKAVATSSNPQKKVSSIFKFAVSTPREKQVPFGIVLVYQKAIIPSIKFHGSTTSIKITQEIMEYLIANIVDMVVVGTMRSSDRCLVFDQLYPGFVAPLGRSYVLRDINLDRVDLSLNRCTLLPTCFIPEKFKLGPISPGSPNDCSGQKFILETDYDIEAY